MLQFIIHFSRIDPSLTKPVKVYPLPHMYIIKDLVPVSVHTMFKTQNPSSVRMLHQNLP